MNKIIKVSFLITCSAVLLAANGHASAQLEDWASLLRKMYADSVLYLSVKGIQDEKNSSTWGGSAFIVHPRGFAITAAHVVLGDGVYIRREIAAKTRSKVNGRSWSAQIIKVDSDLDIALIKLPDPQDAGVRWIPIPVSDSNMLATDEEVVTLGYSSDTNTDGLESYKGVVSSAMQKYGWIPISNTTFNPGNSGAPVFGREMHVVGWVVGGRRDDVQKNYVVPINFARGVLALSGVSSSR